MMAGDDDLDALRDALDRATPRPDPAVRAAHLRTAQQSFARVQGAAAPARDRRAWWDWPWGRGALAGAAVAACGVLVLVPVGRGIWDAPLARDEVAGGGAAGDAAAKVGGAETAEATPEEMTEVAQAAPEAVPAPAATSEPMAEITAMAAPEAAAVAADEAPSAARTLAAADAAAGSYAEVRAALLGGALPPREAVRVGDLVGALAGDGSGGVLTAPWDSATRLVVVGAGAEVDWPPGLEVRPLAEGGPVAIFAVTGAATGPDGSPGGLGPDAAGPETRFAVAVAGWALLLRGEIEGWTFAEAAALAEANRGADPDGRRAEAVDLMRRSAALAR